MKFSIVGAATILLASIASVKGDALGEAVQKFCGGLSVPSPAQGVYTPGTELNFTITNKPGDQYQKVITNLHLYQVEKVNNQDKLVQIQEIWEGRQPLVSEASLKNKLGQSGQLNAGNYYYRSWVSNVIDGGRGPTCTPTSVTFQVTTGSHVNDAGELKYNEDLLNKDIYNPDHLRGCYGLNINEPKDGQVFTKGEHAHITIERKREANTDTIKRIEQYKLENGNKPVLVETVFDYDEVIFDFFNLKDNLIAPAGPNTEYYYKIIGNNGHDGECAYFTPKFFIKDGEN
ncbi:unnamed protein product [Cunninghamella echinulata]